LGLLGPRLGHLGARLARDLGLLLEHPLLAHVARLGPRCPALPHLDALVDLPLEARHQRPHHRASLEHLPPLGEPLLVDLPQALAEAAAGLPHLLPVAEVVEVGQLLEARALLRRPATLPPR